MQNKTESGMHLSFDSYVDDSYDDSGRIIIAVRGRDEFTGDTNITEHIVRYERARDILKNLSETIKMYEKHSGHNGETAVITAEIKAKVGDRVMALNYRRRPAVWEPAVVRDVSIGVWEDGTTCNSYGVVLDRKIVSDRKPWGVPIRLYLGDDGIQYLKGGGQ